MRRKRDLIVERLAYLKHATRLFLDTERPASRLKQRQPPVLGQNIPQAFKVGGRNCYRPRKMEGHWLTKAQARRTVHTRRVAASSTTTPSA